MLLEEDFDEPEPPEDLMSLDDDDDDDVVDDGTDLDDEEFVEFDPSGRYGRYAEVLGKGAVKTVYKAYDMVDCKEVAWNKAKLSTEGPAEQAHAVEREVCLLERLAHKGIIKLYSAWVDEDSDDTNFITELCSSSLLAFRLKHKHVSRKVVKSWARQILEALVHLHTQDPPIIHRDLKCENIFVKYSSSTVLKIGDFGSATVLDETHRMHALVGTPEFMAPEMFQEDYNELVDVYSFGMCMLELLTRECPYSECKSLAQIYKNVTSGKKPKSLQKVKDVLALQFISRCLLPACNRPSAKELLADPFLLHKTVSVNSAQAMNASNSMPSLRNFTTSLPGKLIFGDGNASKPALLCVPREGTIEEPGGATNNATDALCAPKNSPLCRSYQVMGTVEDENTLRLRIRIQESSRCSNIVFPFNLSCDTPQSVAEEMVRTLDYPQSDMSTIADLITEELAILTLNAEEGLAVPVYQEGLTQTLGNLLGNAASSESLDASVGTKLQLGQSPAARVDAQSQSQSGQYDDLHKSRAAESGSSSITWVEIEVPADHDRANHLFYEEMWAVDQKSNNTSLDQSYAPRKETLAEGDGEKHCSVIANVVTTHEESQEILFEDQISTTLISNGSSVFSDALEHEEPFMEPSSSVSKETSGSSPGDLHERSSTASHNKRLRHLVLRSFSKFKQRPVIAFSENGIRRRRPLYVNTLA